MSETTEAALLLPRPLVNQLLRTAQAAINGSAWGIIGASSSQPLHCYPLQQLDSANLDTAKQRLEQAGETLFALYCSDAGPSSESEPSVFDKAGLNVPLHLYISLGTKGVLQLRGWRKNETGFTELEIRISEI